MAVSKDITPADANPVSDGAAKTTASATGISLIDRFLALLSSVPFGVSLLVILIILSMTGMLIQQQELETFR
ncbi:MAG: hypothetical protein ACKV2V_09500, partial [Blastocatellia bacterium]